MIAIIDNGQSYEDRAVLFIECLDATPEDVLAAVRCRRWDESAELMGSCPSIEWRDGYETWGTSHDLLGPDQVRTQLAEGPTLARSILAGTAAKLIATQPLEWPRMDAHQRQRCAVQAARTNDVGRELLAWLEAHP